MCACAKKKKKCEHGFFSSFFSFRLIFHFLSLSCPLFLFPFLYFCDFFNLVFSLYVCVCVCVFLKNKAKDESAYELLGTALSVFSKGSSSSKLDIVFKSKKKTIAYFFFLLFLLCLPSFSLSLSLHLLSSSSLSLPLYNLFSS